MDLGKAVAALMSNPGDVLDYLEIVGKGQPITVKPIPLIAVPTTSGTGSEVTKNAVLKSEEHGRKASMRHDSMLPLIAIIDPCLSLTCPQQVCTCLSLDLNTSEYLSTLSQCHFKNGCLLTRQLMIESPTEEANLYNL